jgi:hypothetical protein
VLPLYALICGSLLLIGRQLGTELFPKAVAALKGLLDRAGGAYR